MENFLTLRQASKITGYHPDYLSSLIRNKKLPAKRIGRTWCVTEGAIRNFIKEKKYSAKTAGAKTNEKSILPLKTLVFRWAAFAAIFVVALVCLRIILWPAVNSLLLKENIANASGDKEIYTVTRSVVTYYSDSSKGGIHPADSAISVKK